MYPGFHKSYNGHALKHITKTVENPIAAIGVGDGETLSPIKNAVKYPSVLKPVMEPTIATSSYEYTQIDGFSDPITPDNFPTGMGIGSPLEGWGY